MASDHAGIALRDKIREHVTQSGHDVVDLGPIEANSVDYPDYAAQVAERVADREFDRGILVCGTGLGMQITANKIPGVRAVTPYDEATARLSREHNNANVACFGDRVQDHSDVLKLADIWLETEFAGGRHERRVAKITAIEKQHSA